MPQVPPRDRLPSEYIYTQPARVFDCTPSSSRHQADKLASKELNQQRSGPQSRFGHMSSPRSAPRTTSRCVPLGEDDVLSHNSHSPESSPLEIDHSLATDLGTLVNMADQLRPSLPADCLWLGQKDLKVTGTHPAAAGGFADVWAGEMNNRKIAIKSYRCHVSADYAQIYSASSA